MQSPYKKYIPLLLIIAGCSLNSCGQEIKHQVKTDTLSKEWNQTIPGNFSGQTKSVMDSTRLDAFFESYPALQNYAGRVRDFYRKRNYAFAWFDDGRLIEQAGNLSNRVMNLQTDGIYKTVPYQNILDSLIHDIDFKATKNRPDTRLELMLTTQYFVFAKLAWGGMNALVSDSAKWYVPRKKVNYNDYLDSLSKSPTKRLSAGEPVYRQYELLRGFLKKYLALDASGQWSTVDYSALLKPGDTAASVVKIKIRLFKLEDFHGDTLNNTYNNELVTAVRQFQDRNGQQPNGLLDKATITALNVPLKTRIKQILVNMERSRWLPVRLNGDYLAVNIPEFQLHVYHADSLLWSCKVVVGQSVHQTTVFYGEVKYVVFSPYWNVPQSIVLKEIIPGIRKDINYIQKHDMEIIGYHGKIPVVRQKPGPENSLGLVKFLFPNTYDIYLHDTPMKSLFGENSRAFSHGCIRVVEPVKLASFLLKNNPEWNAANMDEAMHSGKERYVTLKQKMPVFIAYFTAFTDRNGLLNFRKDIYNLDDHLAAMIVSGSGEY
jgi:murein L,D-transpeptidase YcbB/YkuD